MTEKQEAALRQALKKAFDLGKRYWSWADSEYSSHWKKADVAQEQFYQLVEDTINEALAEQPCKYPNCPYPCPDLQDCRDAEPPCKTGSQCTSKCQQCEQPAKEQKLEFVSPGGGYVPAIPRPIPLDWKLVPRKATPEMLRAMDECAQEGYDERLYEGMASSVYMAAWDASPVMGTLPEQTAQQQEPVAEVLARADNTGTFVKWKRQPKAGMVLYTSPPASKPWVGLTQQDIDIAFDDTQEGGGFNEFAYAIEAKLREKNEHREKNA